MLTIGELVRRHAQTRPRADAYVELNRRTSWAALYQRTSALGHALRAQGVSPGIRVGMISSDAIEVAEVVIACARIGAIRVGISGRLAPREIAHLIDDAGPVLLFVQRQYANQAANALAMARTQPRIIIIEGDAQATDCQYEALLAGAAQAGSLADTPHDKLMFAYTTGSTGLPKGAVYRHEPFVRSLCAIALAEGAQHDDVWLQAMPASGIPVMHLLRNLCHGSKCVIVGDWSPEVALQLIEREKATITVLVPTMLTSLLDSGLMHQYDTSSMRQLGYGAAPIAPATMRKAIRAFGCDLLQMYGSTELMGMSMMLYPSDHDKGLSSEHSHILASAGRALPFVDVKIVDDAGNELPAGETGELLIASPFVIEEYWNNTEQYRQTVVDGWLRTGDMARIDADGYLFLGDRAKFRIKTGGYNVFPTEVENVLAEHPALLEVCVVGIPDPTWGERIHAVVSLRSQASVTPDELREFCRGKIAGFKIPKTIDIWPDIPKGVTGKILKREIIEKCSKTGAAA